jgi:menaquinol-cytochrome c reductase iron-sulfur subunit
VTGSGGQGGNGLSRRAWLAWLTGLSGAALSAVAGVPLLSAILSPLRRRGPEAGFVRVARLAALPEGRPVRASVVAPAEDAWTRLPAEALGAVWLVRSGATVRAFSSICPHLGCGVDADGGRGFRCPCHDSAFDLAGERRSGPAPRGLDPIPVRVSSGEDPAVEVRYQRFIAGRADRRPA